MDIRTACRTVCQWRDLLSLAPTAQPSPASLSEAVAVIKAYLEHAREQQIRELEISDEMLMTRQGVRWVMPFALSAESIEAGKRASQPPIDLSR